MSEIYLLQAVAFTMHVDLHNQQKLCHILDTFLCHQYLVPMASLMSSTSKQYKNGTFLGPGTLWWTHTEAFCQQLIYHHRLTEKVVCLYVYLLLFVCQAACFCKILTQNSSMWTHIKVPTAQRGLMTTAALSPSTEKPKSRHRVQLKLQFPHSFGQEKPCSVCAILSLLLFIQVCQQ